MFRLHYIWLHVPSGSFSGDAGLATLSLLGRLFLGVSFCASIGGSITSCCLDFVGLSTYSFPFSTFLDCTCSLESLSCPLNSGPTVGDDPCSNELLKVIVEAGRDAS